MLLFLFIPSPFVLRPPPLAPKTNSFWFVASAAGAQEEPLPGGVVMPRVGDGLVRVHLCDACCMEAEEMRRRMYILLC